MNMILTFTIVFATLMLAVSVMNKVSNHRLLGELDDLKSRLKESEKEKKLLREEVMHITKKGGVSEETVLSIAGEIARMENNLHHMEEVPGRKQVMKALERMKCAFQTEDYAIVPLLVHPHIEDR